MGKVKNLRFDFFHIKKLLLLQMESINKFDYDPSKWSGEINSGELLVEPDQTMTIREIFEKFKLGIPMDDMRRNLEYNDTDSSVNYAVDEMDMMNELSNIEARVKRRQSMANRENEVKASKSIEQAVETQVEKEKTNE